MGSFGVKSPGIGSRFLDVWSYFVMADGCNERRNDKQQRLINKFSDRAQRCEELSES